MISCVKPPPASQGPDEEELLAFLEKKKEEKKKEALANLEKKKEQMLERLANNAANDIILFSGNMGGGLGSHSRSLDLVMKQEAPDGPDVSNRSVYLPICSSHLILACVLLPHAYGFPLPFDACPAPLVTRA